MEYSRAELPLCTIINIQRLYGLVILILIVIVIVLVVVVVIMIVLLIVLSMCVYV